MADGIPWSFGSVSFPLLNYYCGPFKAPNGFIYVVLRNAADYPKVYKCSDFDFPETGGFAAVSGGPSTQAIPSMWAYMSGTMIHIVYSNLGASDDYYYYAAFDTTDDGWDYTAEQIDTWDDKYRPTSSACSIVQRDSDGGQEPTVVLHNGPNDKVGGSYYGRVHCAYRTSGGSWTTRVDVSATDDASYSGCVGVRGSAPDANGHVVHFFWGETLAGAQYARTLRYNSGWQLSATVTSPQNGASNANHNLAPGIYYDDSGTDRVLVPLEQSDINYVWMVPEDSSGDLDGTGDSAYTVDSVYGAVYAGGESLTACIAIDNTSGKAYFMWGEKAGDGSDLRRSDASAPYSSWSASTEEETGIADRISCNVYPRNGSLKLAFIWDDNGTIKYDEYDIGQETAPGYAAARLPAQNYKIGPFSV